MATITDTGLSVAAKLLNGVSSAPFKYMAIGSGTTDESATQTALASEMTTGGAARQLATCGYEAPNKAVWSATFTNSSGSTWTVNEFGIFDAATGGDMLLRHKFATTKNVDVGSSITIIVKVAPSR